MHRIDSSGTAVSMPTPGAVGGTVGYFTNGSALSGIPATIIDEDWLNAVQEELMSLLAAGGITASKTVFTQLTSAIRALRRFRIVQFCPVVNINVASPGAGPFDTSYTPAVGDLCLLVNQTTATQNGIYNYNGSAVAMTRADDATLASQILSGTMIMVQSGTTNKNHVYVLATPPGFTIGTTALTFTDFDALPQAPANANVKIAPTGTGTAIISPAAAGTMDNMAIGQTTPAAANFTGVLVNNFSSSADFGVKASGTKTYVFGLRSSVASTNMVLTVDGLTPSSSGESAANTMLMVRKDSTTSRSINAVGTVNVNGADYAEYETKAAGCGTFAKGDVVGFDVNGLLTDTWANALSFGIKSTAPSYVGGDGWGSAEALGVPSPGDGPEEPQRSDGQSDEDWAAAQATYTAALETYNSAVAALAAAAEAMRPNVDRIAYSGKVPVNVAATNVGDYIVAVQNGTGISGQAIAASALTFAQYQLAIGRVRKIIDATHCEVSVVVH